MIRNVPCRVTQAVVLEVIDEKGFAGTYNFLYLPSAGRPTLADHRGLGYGFINFRHWEDASRFARAFADFQFPKGRSEKRLEISPAHIQGLQDNLRFFKRAWLS